MKKIQVSVGSVAEALDRFERAWPLDYCLFTQNPVVESRVLATPKLK
jgi:hypothetical protein